LMLKSVEHIKNTAWRTFIASDLIFDAEKR